MSPADHIRDDLDYVARTVRHQDRPTGVPVIYFMWAVLVAVGFALPDFAPQWAGAYWMVAGIGGGLLSWQIGARDGRKRGISDKALGARYGYHWTIGGVGFLLGALPTIAGQVEPAQGAANFLLVGGLVYALAGVHLERPLIWSGLLMLLAYTVLVLFAPPYVWTITGIVIAISLVWAGLASHRQRAATDPQ